MKLKLVVRALFHDGCAPKGVQVAARPSLAAGFFDAAKPTNNPYGEASKMTKAKQLKSRNPLDRHLLRIIVLSIIVMIAGVSTWAIIGRDNKHVVDKNTAARTCEQWRSGAELPLKLSSTDPSQFTGRELQEYLEGGSNYVYYFVADGSQKDAIGKPYAAGKAVFSAPSYFTKDTAYIDHIKPALDEIGNSSATDAQQYLMGDNFKNIVLNAINQYNQNHQHSTEELCAQFTDNGM